MGTRWTFRPHPSSSADPGWMALYTSSTTTTHKGTLMVLCSLELEDPNCPAKRNNGFFHPFPTYIYRPCCDSGRCMLYTLIMDMLKFIVDINLSRNSFLFSILLAQKNYSNRLMRLFCFVLFFVGEEKFTLGSFGHEQQTPIHIPKFFCFFFFV